MLAGQAAVAIWNGITDEGRDDFYAWHVIEHMPERVGIPGFLRGRRYRSTDAATHPQYFTLYELQTFEVTLGQDYLSRLNAPTPWTKKATAAFRDTSRGLSRILMSTGPGPGGALATIRFGVDENDEAAAKAALSNLMLLLSRLPQVTGAHLGLADADASGVKTAESKDRADVQAPPRWFALIEACSTEALDAPIEQMEKDKFVQQPNVGRYLHEYTRLKNDWTAG